MLFDRSSLDASAPVAVNGAAAVFHRVSADPFASDLSDESEATLNCDFSGESPLRRDGQWCHLQRKLHRGRGDWMSSGYRGLPTISCGGESSSGVGRLSLDSFRATSAEPCLCSASSSSSFDWPTSSCSSSDSASVSAAVCELHAAALRERLSLPIVPSCQALKKAVLALYRLDDFVLEKIGQGFFSEVYKVRHRNTNEVMVLKLNKISSNRPNVLREVQLMRKLRHPNVLRFRGVCVDNGQLHALTDYCNAGSLDSLILSKEFVTIPWSLRVSLALDVGRGIDYIHTFGYIHRDLTSKNILTKRSGVHLTAVIGDLGLACKVPLDPSTKLSVAGTPYWMAPECLNDEWYNEKADIFSFGIILCEIIAEVEADPDVLPRTSTFGLDYNRFIKMCHPETPIEFLNLAFRCCLMDPNSRPTSQQVITLALDVLRVVRKKKSYKNLFVTSPPVGGGSSSDTMVRALSLRRRSSDQSLHSMQCTAGRFSVNLKPTGLAGSMLPMAVSMVAINDPLYQPSPERLNPFAGDKRFEGGRKILTESFANNALDLVNGVATTRDENDNRTCAGGVGATNGDDLFLLEGDLYPPFQRTYSLPVSSSRTMQTYARTAGGRGAEKSAFVEETPATFSDSHRRMTHEFSQEDEQFVNTKIMNRGRKPDPDLKEAMAAASVACVFRDPPSTAANSASEKPSSTDDCHLGCPVLPNGFTAAAADVLPSVSGNFIDGLKSSVSYAKEGTSSICDGLFSNRCNIL